MENAVYCLASVNRKRMKSSHILRNLGFTASEISILLKDKDTRNISVKEDVIRGAEKGGIAGGILGALAGLTVLTPCLLFSEHWLSPGPSLRHSEARPSAVWWAGLRAAAAP